MSRVEVLDRVRAMVAYARDLCPDVEFSPEDAGRSEPEFLYQVLEAAIAAGATTLNIPDTVGYTIPSEFGALIAGIRKNVPEIDRAVVSVHCHNDLGLATANALEGIRAGARQAEVTINGIGERAGNAALEEIVMALEVRADALGFRTTVVTTELFPTSRALSAVVSVPVQPNKAIVGDNAFAHEAGIHQDGMVKNPLTYEIMRPESVGAPPTRLVLGRHSGMRGLDARCRALGHRLRVEDLRRLYARMLEAADRAKEVDDAELTGLIRDLVAPIGFAPLPGSPDEDTTRHAAW